MQFYILFTTAQIQFGAIIPYIATLIALIGAFVSVKTLSIRMNELRQENEAIMASKIYVKEEVAKVEVTALNIASDIKSYKGEHNERHEREHKATNEKLDLIIKLIDK